MSPSDLRSRPRVFTNRSGYGIQATRLALIMLSAENCRKIQSIFGFGASLASLGSLSRPFHAALHLSTLLGRL